MAGQEKRQQDFWVWWFVLVWLFEMRLQSSQIRRNTSVLKWQSKSVFILTLGLPDPSVLHFFQL